jgi:hypothetical protein
MRARHLGTAFLALGVLVGTAAGVGLLVGFEPARLPAALLNIAAYKLTFLAALGLLAAGAVLARHARRGEARAASAAAARRQLRGADDAPAHLDADAARDARRPLSRRGW